MHFTTFLYVIYSICKGIFLHFQNVFVENSEVDLKFDLLDPCIAICSPAIPPLFSDHFDCQTLDGFIKEVLQNELIDNTIYMDQIESDYAAKMSNFRRYLCTNVDVINRWMYPLVPDVTFGRQGEFKCKLQRHQVYRGDQTIIER